MLGTMSRWRDRMSENLRLHDYRERTQASYMLATDLFFRWVNKPPAKVEEGDLRTYFLHLREEKKQAPSSINVAICATRFFFVDTMQRDWSVFDLVRARRALKLPVVLSTREVRAIFAAVEQPVYRMAFITLYAFGLRINEGLHLETGDIDADRNTLWVRDGKGARDRAVPLPRPVLGRLRAYWKEDRPAVPSKLIFPGLDGQRPPDPSTLQKAFTAARLAAKVDKPCTPIPFRVAA